MLVSHRGIPLKSHLRFFIGQRQRIVAWSFFTFFFLPGRLLGAPPPDIRVQVFTDLTAAAVEPQGSVSTTITDENGKAYQRSAKVFTVIPQGEGFRINGEAFAAAEIALTNHGDLWQVNDKLLHGTLTFVNAGKTFSIVNTLPLEEYLTGLINSEISTSWPKEVIKAQAVAARSYAYAARERARKKNPPSPFDLTSTVLDQVYKSAQPDDHATAAVIAATHGEMLQRKGSVYSAYYHSCCGGQTEHASNVWQHADGPPPVIDRYCARSPKLVWEYRLPQAEFIAKLHELGISAKKIVQLEMTQFADSLRNQLIVIADRDQLHMVATNDLRKTLGYTNMKSTWFNAALQGDEIAFAGRGYGHGVGMCQWGAKGMAEEGKSYRDILKFYYPDAALVKMY